MCVYECMNYLICEQKRERQNNKLYKKAKRIKLHFELYNVHN